LAAPWRKAEGKRGKVREDDGGTKKNSEQICKRYDSQGKYTKKTTEKTKRKEKKSDEEERVVRTKPYALYPFQYSYRALLSLPEVSSDRTSWHPSRTSLLQRSKVVSSFFLDDSLYCLERVLQ
jgi:hypothetical protein